MGWLQLAGFAAVFAVTTFSPTMGAVDSEQERLALETATMFRAARKVISDNQAHINDATKGDKELDGAKVLAATKANYKLAVGREWQDAAAGTLLRDVQVAMSETITEVMANAQPLINEKGKGFKGFLPAVFAKAVADGVSKKLDGRVFIKLTAPKDYIRNRKNRPDAWEHDVIEKKFRSKEWTKGKEFTEVGAHNGRQGLRLMIPEYYGASCLSCHGDPKGERDITGGLKEGGKLDEVGGASSVVIYANDPQPTK
jgi:hypothetical protein